MIHDGVLCLDQLAGLLVAHAARRLVMTKCFSCALHKISPPLYISATIHILTITQKNLTLIVDIRTEVSLMAFSCDGTLFDNGQSEFPLSKFPMVVFHRVSYRPR